MINKNRLFVIFLIFAVVTLIFALMLIFLNRQLYGQKNDFKDYIMLSENSIPVDVMEDVMEVVVDGTRCDEKATFVNLISLLATKYYGDWSRYSKLDFDFLLEEIKQYRTEEELENVYAKYTHFKNYYEALFGGFVGKYKIAKINSKSESGSLNFREKFGLKAYFPIAYGFEASYCDDFDCEKLFNKKYLHIGNDIAAREGTPFVAVEGGTILNCGKNKKGIWQLILKSFDEKRQYCYSNCLADHPFAENIKVGTRVCAGQPLGYVGLSSDCNRGGSRILQSPCLHFTAAVILKLPSEEKTKEIAIDYYNILKFLEHHKSVVLKANNGKDYIPKYIFKDETTIF